MRVQPPDAGHEHATRDRAAPDAGDGPFRVKDCALIAIATGRRAQNLVQFRDQLLLAHPGSIYHHFWGGRLSPSFADPEYQNDFAAWARHALHDKVLAERLGIIDPAEYATLEDLRRELVDTVEERLDEREIVPAALPDQQFQFIRSQIVVFDTHQTAGRPADLARVVARMSLGSVYYHVIDATGRTEAHIDDFRAWLAGFGDQYAALLAELAAIDHYFLSLGEIRDALVERFARHLGGAT